MGFSEWCGSLILGLSWKWGYFTNLGLKNTKLVLSGINILIILCAVKMLKVGH